MLVRYRLDDAQLPARLDHADDTPRLIVTYETEHVVCPVEARRDCELISATSQELEALRGARYEIPLAADFREMIA